jgi:hypothetical protein
MPEYVFECKCGSIKHLLFKSVPSESRRNSSVCDECGGVMERNYGKEGFYATGGTNFEIQKVGSFAMTKVDQGGRKVPVFKDANGRVHEVRNSSDIRNWQKNNQSGSPRMVEWRNPKTGEKTWVPQRTIMHADPVTGEPMDKGSVIRESAKLVQLNNNWSPPTYDKQTQYRIDPKTLATVKPESKPFRHSKHCMCVGCCMGDDNDAGYRGGVDSKAFLPRG